MSSTRASALVALSLVLAAPALSSCGLLGGGDRLDDALDVLPAGAGHVSFADHGKAMEAAGLDDLETGSLSDADLDAYVDAVEEDPALQTPLTAYLTVMQDAPFSDLDVVWFATAEGPDRPATVYRLDDDVDLDAVADDLAAGGLSEDEVAGRRHLTFDPSSTDPTDPSEVAAIAGHYPLDFFEVTVDPDEHLLVVGDGATVLATIDGDRDSVSDDGSLDAVLDGAGDVDAVQAALTVDCGRGLGRASAEAVARRDAQVGGLGTPSSVAYVISGDDETVRLAFADDAAAEADAAARATYLEDGELLTAQPVGDLGRFEVDRDGAVVVVSLDLESPTAPARFLADQDGPAACPAG